MSEAFTLTSANCSIIDHLEELRLAFSERHFACLGTFQKYVWQDDTYQWVEGDGTENDCLQNTSPVVEDETTTINIQSVAFFRGIQDFIDDGGTDSNYSSDPIRFATPDVDESPMLDTISEFYEMVGGDLYTSSEDYGLRRSTGHVDGVLTMERGLAEAGDIKGAWLIDDLLACLSAITATRVFYEYDDDGIRDDLHRCGVFIECPSWYSRVITTSTVIDYYQMIEILTCTTTLTYDEYQAQVRAGTLPDGDWNLYEPDDEDSYYVDYDSATLTYGYPEPWDTLVAEDLENPPAEAVIPSGDWVKQTVWHYEYDTVEENGSGYPSVAVYDYEGNSLDTYKWCSYTPVATLGVLTFDEGLTAPTIPTAASIDFFTEVDDAAPSKIGRYLLDGTDDESFPIKVVPSGDQSFTTPYFIANWDFTNS